MKPILFGRDRDSVYAAFSNFHPAAFDLDGHRWACSEQAYMYRKSDDPEYQTKVLATPKGSEVKRLGSTATLRPDWDEVKYGFMVRVLLAKFGQNQHLRNLLLLTGDRPIHEDRPDPWWGGGPNFPTGRDLLGKALMEVRAMLRAQEPPEMVI